MAHACGHALELGAAVAELPQRRINGVSASSPSSDQLRNQKPQKKLALTSSNLQGRSRNGELGMAKVALPSLLLASSATPANAVTAEDITNAILKVQEVTQQATDTATNAYTVTKSFIDQFLIAIKPAVDTAAPYVQKATDAAINAASPFAYDVATQAENVLKSAGVDTKPVLEAAKTAVVVAGEAADQTSKVIESAKPVASSTVESIASSDPLFLAGGLGVVAVLYFAFPALISSVVYSARGYQGDLSAPQVLDLLSKSDYVLLDVRTDKEKSRSGLPSLPRNAKNKFLSIPLEELPGKLRGQLRNARKVEAEITALKISYLKRIGRGSNVILLDSSGDVAKSVAKSLSALGFKNTWVVLDGFDGSKGWVQSRLGTENFNSPFAEVLSATRIIPAGTKRLFKNTSSDLVDVTPRYNRLLPGGSEE